MNICPRFGLQCNTCNNGCHFLGDDRPKEIKMILTEEERKAFAAAAEPLIEWVAQNCHPHTSVVLDANSAELLEGVAAHRTDKFLRD